MWRYAYASVVGTSHQRLQTPCQDASYVMLHGNKIIIAVADGLGSAAHSEVGADIACRVATDSMSKAFQSHATTDMQSLCTAAFTDARNAIMAEAIAQEKQLRDFACTLLLVIIDDTQWVVQHIGDGAVVGFLSDGTIKTMSAPDNGEFINSTYPLTSTDYLAQLRFTTQQEQLSGVAVLSDGVQPMCINYKTGAAFPGFFTPLVTWLRNLAQPSAANEILQKMLNSEQFRQKSDDDMTLVLAIRE